MNLPEYSLRNAKVIWFFLFVLLAGGALGFSTLGKKEDSVFVIKSASLVCSYPGATPPEVEELITEPIEREVQSMRLVHKITSESYYGVSKIQVELDPATPAREIPQLWDELRRKVLNVQPKLPAGASQITVADDFGDVYGIYYGLSVDGGFSWSELRDWAQRLKTALVTIDGVQKVTLYGEQTPVVNVYVSLAALANFSIRPETIVSTIGQQNSIVDSGEKQAGKLRIQILEDGTYKTLDDLADQLLFATSGKQYRLGDIARVERGYAEPPQTMMRVDGRRAVGIGISTEAGVDVVKAGAKIDGVLASLTRQMPVGMELTVLYPENRIAREANSTFILNLAESVAIVILIIMLVMGFRAGVLIGSSLLFSIGGTLLLMQFLGEGLNRTSLAGFIIAMGMLVDNAIVVTDNAQQAMLRGAGRSKAVVDGANAPRWSLLGATLIAIFSFLPLYLAPSSVAEIVKPLFVVLALSLLLSWVLALTQTPLFGNFMLRVKPLGRDPYDTKFYRAFDRFLAVLLRRRWAVVAVVVGLFALSLVVMGLMPQNFFPSLDKPYFRADVLLPEGYDIRDTERNLLSMEEWLREQPEVKTVSMTLGSTPPRYYLASSSVSMRPNFGNVLVELHDKRQTESVEARFNAWVTANLPDVWLRSSLFKLSPVPDAAIEFGFIGENADTLRRLTAAAEEVMWRTPGAVNIRNGWGNRVPMWQPVYSQMKGQRIGITRSQMARGITIATQGYALGEYREGDQFMPILLKDENIGSYNLTNLQALPIFSPSGKVFSIEQATDGFRFDFRPGVIKRFNRQRVMKAQCDPARGVNTMQLFAALRDSIDRAVALPEGYSMKVFGEQESQQESNEALAEYMPLTLVLILIVLLLLFRNYREPVVILLMIPLIFIGVVLGLAVTGKVFNFFSLLGLLGLVGMNIKNAVVLVEQIGVLRAAGKDPYEALTSATRSRIVPVAMASGTTILGMLPLLFDSMFGAMAATIMGGLLVATLLTVCVLPVVYALFYNIRKP
ncbi:efflux RND transporter permease subunit [Alistipes senegalensis]|uniref:efflux RND transporter permease subunit n=1 Tax=Alistipes senegalensis TaxID=1288121 RepID=UPI0018A99448|nr:efflux RND transporter permease subunit [Alistipes senegalensis]